jgi:hypothetical protein
VLAAQVLRSYDTRFRPSQRRYEVYLSPGIFDFAEILCKLSDRHAPTLSAESAARRQPDAWLWKEWGSLVVVVTKYHVGRHWTESFAECIAIVRALERLHKAGFVHGDIRCFNIVFGAGALIDFDFGGKVDSKEGRPMVPRGYQRDLPDGSRVGKAGTPITMYHDWYALIQVLTHVHEISHLERYASDLSNLKAKMMELDEGERTIEDLTKEGGAVESVAAAAAEFLTKAEASGCTIAPRQSFKEKLQSVGLYPETVDVDRNASSTATGSPDKRP